RGRRSPSASPSRSLACSRGCCFFSSSPATPSFSTACASSAAAGPRRCRKSFRRPTAMLEGSVLTIITASTPLLLAALGELVAERSGVLNLGVEGMMAVGAVCGFVAADLSGEPLLGALAAILAGMGAGLLFALLTLVFVANQVASGLALTLSGLGL